MYFLVCLNLVIEFLKVVYGEICVELSVIYTRPILRIVGEEIKLTIISHIAHNETSKIT